jgi:hypothetical protein
VGSTPATAGALVVLSSLHMSMGGALQVITTALSGALLLTAAILIGREALGGASHMAR